MSLKIIHNIGKEKLSEYEMKDVDKLLPFDFFVYEYEYGSYEGSGQAILKKDGKYHLFDLGHCSCYGPTDDLNLNGGYESLSELKKHISNYREKESNAVFEKAFELDTPTPKL